MADLTHENHVEIRAAIFDACMVGHLRRPGCPAPAAAVSAAGLGESSPDSQCAKSFNLADIDVGEQKAIMDSIRAALKDAGPTLARSIFG